MLITFGIIIGLATYAVAFTLYFTLKSDTTMMCNENFPETTTEITPENSTTTTTDYCCEVCPGHFSYYFYYTYEGFEYYWDGTEDLPTCRVYCTSNREGPVYINTTSTYQKCCGKLECQN